MGMVNTPGSKGPLEGPDQKRKSTTDPQAFKRVMKAQEVDPDEKKKKKSRQESEMDATAALTAPAPPTGLGESAPLGAPMAPPPVPPAAPGPVAAPPPASYQPPATTGLPDYLPPEEVPQYAAEPSQTPTLPQQPAQAQKTEAPSAPTQPQSKGTVPGKAPSGKGVMKATSTTQVTPTKPSHLESAGGKKAPQPVIKAEEVEQKSAETASLAPPPPAELPKGSWEANKGIEKAGKKEAGETLVTGQVSPHATPILPGMIPTAPPPSPSNPFANLHPQVQQLFERMVGVMTVMHTAGQTQTVINLDSPKFAQSVFFGSRIVISEFSTAPKQFNIELLGNAQANALMSQNAERLVAAFQAGNYTFKVNRLDTALLSEGKEERAKKVTRVKRKEDAGG